MPNFRKVKKHAKQNKTPKNPPKEEAYEEDESMITGMKMLADLSEADMDSSADEDTPPVKKKMMKKKKTTKLPESEEEEEHEEIDSSLSQSQGSEDEEATEEQKEKELSRRENMKKRIRAYKESEDRTVFVGNVPATITRKFVRKLFRPFGTIEAVYQRTMLQMTEKLTKLMMGKNKDLQERLKTSQFYVRYSQVEEAKNAVKQMQGVVLGDGHCLRVNISAKRKSCDSSHSIFIGNLPYQATENQVRALFAECGPVVSVRLLNDKETGQCRGAGYVEFEKKESIAKALEMNGQKLEGRPMRIAKAYKKKKLKKNFESKGAAGKEGARGKAQLPAGANRFMVLKGGHNKIETNGGENQKRKPLTKKVRKEIKRRKTKASGKSLIT